MLCELGRVSSQAGEGVQRSLTSPCSARTLLHEAVTLVDAVLRRWQRAKEARKRLRPFDAVDSRSKNALENFGVLPLSGGQLSLSSKRIITRSDTQASPFSPRELGASGTRQHEATCPKARQLHCASYDASKSYGTCTLYMSCSVPYGYVPVIYKNMMSFSMMGSRLEDLRVVKLFKNELTDEAAPAICRLVKEIAGGSWGGALSSAVPPRALTLNPW